MSPSITSSPAATRSITTSKHAHALATAPATDLHPHTIPAYALPSSSTRYDAPLTPFTPSFDLQPNSRLTVLPTPLPDDMYSPVNEAYYPSSAIQSRLAVIDTCLAGLLDVNRAGKLFDNMRMDLLHPLPESLLNDKLYNRMLEAYFDMVGREPPERREAWLDRGWDLYEDMALGKLRVKPNATTFSIALSTLKRYVSLSWRGWSARVLLASLVRYPSECQKAGKEASEVLNDIIASKDYKGGSALETILTRDGQLEEPQALELVDFAATVAKEAGLLSLASTVEVVRTSLIKTMVDPLEGVPEAVPVTKPASVSASPVSS